MTSSRLLPLLLRWESRRFFKSLSDGDYRSPRLSPSRDLEAHKPYEGEDVQFIDWNATARFGEPLCKLGHAPASATMWLLIDASPSLSFAEKYARLSEIAIALAIPFVLRNNRVGAIAHVQSGRAVVSPSASAAHIYKLASWLERLPDTAAPDASLSSLLAHATAVFPRRSFVVVLSDFLYPVQWMDSLKQLAATHEVLVIYIKDDFERLLPKRRSILRDVETGRSILFDPADARQTAEMLALFEQHNQSVLSALSASGALSVVVDPALTPIVAVPALFKLIANQTRASRRARGVFHLTRGG